MVLILPVGGKWISMSPKKDVMSSWWWLEVASKGQGVRCCLRELFYTKRGCMQVLVGLVLGRQVFPLGFWLSCSEVKDFRSYLRLVICFFRSGWLMLRPAVTRSPVAADRTWGCLGDPGIIKQTFGMIGWQTIPTQQLGKYRNFKDYFWVN